MERYESYKGSGVEWIGEIPKEWEVKKLSYCFDNIGSGTTPTSGKSEYYFNGTINWLQTGDLNDGDILNTSKKITQKALYDYPTLRMYPVGSLVIAMYGATIGKTGVLQIDTTTNQACCVLARSNSVNSKFAFYWLNSITKHVISLAYGGGQPNINQEMIRSLKIQLPPSEEQTAIANYLDRKTAEIDALIAQKQRLIELYQEEKTAIINQAVTQGVDPNITFKDTGINCLGEIPEGWEIKKLKYETYKIGDGIHTTPNYISGTGIFFINGMNLSGRKISITENTLSVPIGEYEKYKIDLNVGSILISLNGTIGNLAIYNGEKVIFGKSAAYIEIKEKIYNLFLYYVLQTQYALNYFEDSFSGTTIKNLSLHTLRNTPLPLPSICDQQSIVQLIETEIARVDAKIAKTQRIIELQKEYRTALISEVVTGKIKVSHLLDKEMAL